LKWDKRKRNFVQVTGKKSFKNESGKKIFSKEKNQAGKAYENWEKTSKMRIGRSGEHEGSTNLSYLMYQDINPRMKMKLGIKSKNKTQTGEDEVKSEVEILRDRKEKFKIQQKQKGIKRKRLSSNNTRETKKRRGAPSKSKLLF